MSVLFDSSICIAIMRGRPAGARERMHEANLAGIAMAISSIVLFELWLGIESSAHKDANARLLFSFLKAVRILSFDEDDAQAAGALQAELRRRGREIGPYDLLIATQALRRNLLLVTSDRDFSRVPNLRWENWTA